MAGPPGGGVGAVVAGVVGPGLGVELGFVQLFNFEVELTDVGLLAVAGAGVEPDTWPLVVPAAVATATPSLAGIWASIQAENISCSA